MTLILIGLLSSRPAHRGRLRETLAMMERDAAPAGGDERTPLPGGPGTRPGGTRTPPRGARWTGTGANASSQEARTRRLCLWRKPGREAAMERREAPALWQRSAARRKTGAPLGAPSPRFVRGGEKGRRRTRRRLNNTGAQVRPVGIRAMTHAYVRPTLVLIGLHESPHKWSCCGTPRA